MMPAHPSICLNLGDITVSGFHQNPRTHCQWLLLFPQKYCDSQSKEHRQGKTAGALSQMPAPPLFRLYQNSSHLHLLPSEKPHRQLR